MRAVYLLIGLYFPVMTLLGLGFARLRRSRRANDGECVGVTVLVSARNEERDFPACLSSLLALDYPREKLQIVLVDDLSTDGTGALIDQAAPAHAHIVAIHSSTLPPNGLDAKARGIAHGFAHATGDWVLITDADATVHPQWIRHMLGRVTAETGMVGGVLAVEPTGFVGILESLSWAYTQLFSLGLAGWSAPMVCSGPNMAIRRSVYVQAGGLEQVRFRVAEDLALFQMVTERNLRVQCYAGPETTATLQPVPTLRHLLSQQRRWLAGGLATAPAYRIPLLAAFWWGVAVAAFIIAGWTIGVNAWLAFLGAKALLDIALLSYQRSRLKRMKLVRYIWLLEMYHGFIFLMLAPSFLFSRKVHWMGEGYTVTYE